MSKQPSAFHPLTKQQRPAGFRDPRELAGMRADTPLCIALSGGADSVALLCLLAGDPLVCAVHVHHGIRGAEADRDAQFCRDVAARCGVPLTVLHIDAPLLAQQKGISLETAAREGRYAAIVSYMQANGIPLLATAHHADDQLETVLQHLLRGSGLHGLSGIPICRPLAPSVFVVRPLLQVQQAELRALLHTLGLSYVEDSTNREPCCVRNRLRLEVTPTLNQLYPGCAAVVARAAESLREDEAFLQSLAADFLREHGDTPPLHALAALPRPIFARVMRTLLPQALQQVHIEDLLTFCRKATPHATLSLPGVRVHAEDGRLCFSKQASPDTPHELSAAYEVILKEGDNPLPGGGSVVMLPRGSTHPRPIDTPYRYCIRIPLCKQGICGVLRARTMRPGDRLHSGGVNRAVRRLPGSAVSAATRTHMPLLADDNGILACPFGTNHNVRDGAFAKETPDIEIFLLFD